eukprot:TRINITY_DN99939_c0_g1_i1.p1 TRINITY_DN99939_c0_g1~~TRINITY_DN99939_c0_g1_i1.p1  ORF type:complete len:142 (-),score=45.31 TRINITY_DN99939_c0_g1_i1:46-471(-)
MSLAALLNLGKKEEPKEKKASTEERPTPPVERSSSSAASTKSQAELNVLNEFIGKQTQVTAKVWKVHEQEEKEIEASRKRLLEDAAQQAARRAKLKKVQADLNNLEGQKKLCKFFFIAGTTNAGCHNGDKCRYSHDIDSLT